MTRALAAIIPVSLAATLALAGWPSDPSTPLVVGPAQGSFGPRQSLVTAPDASVWLAWQDSFCGGFDDGVVRLQRIALDGSLLAPAGIAAAPDETCGFILPPVLAPIGDGALVARALSGLNLEPVQAFDADGASSWPTPFSSPNPDVLGAAAVLESGDVLIVSTAQFGVVRADRLDAGGAPVWPATTEFDSLFGSHPRIFAVVPDPTGGAIIFYDDSAFAYTRLVRAHRLAADGSPAWASPIRFQGSPPDVTSSRHTDPVAVSDGAGGAVLIFAEGFESGFTPAPLLMQRVNADGDLAFPLSGHRVSLATERQFDPIVLTDPDTHDLLIVWRDGFLDSQTVRAQRITTDGQRLWTDDGIEIAAIGQADTFDAIWQRGLLSVVIADESDVILHTRDAIGQPALAPVVVGAGGRPVSVRMTPSADGAVVTWQDDLDGLDDRVVAQRINAGGRLGDPSCNPADLAEPIGSLDFSDVVAFLGAFAAASPAADLAAPFGAFDFSDVVAFLGAFAAGCP